MKEVGKYNLFKVLSILLTCIPTALVALSYSDTIIKDKKASVSFVAIIAIIIVILFLKDKILENFKTPSPFVIALVLFIIIVLFEQIILPAKFVSMTVMIACGIDELSFKRIYKRIEFLLPEKAKAYKHVGFYFCTTNKVLGDNSRGDDSK